MLPPQLKLCCLLVIVVTFERYVEGQAVATLEETWKNAAVGGKGCGKNFGCFTDPAGCDLNKNGSCRNFVLYRQNPSNQNLVDFYIEGDGGEDRYLALGLNTQPRMDGASVLMCKKETGKPATLVNTYNQGYKNVPLLPSQERLGITEVRAMLSPNGKQLICSFSKVKNIGTDRIHRLVTTAGLVTHSPLLNPSTVVLNFSVPRTTVVTGKKVVVISNTSTQPATKAVSKRNKRQASQSTSTGNVAGTPIPYYLIIAESGVANGLPQYHAVRAPVVSGTPINVAQSVSAIPARSGPDVLIRLHGIFMIIGWIFFVSLAILFARHLKNLSPDKTMCGGLKLWFVFHRTANYIALLFIIVGAILIFVSIRAWSYDGNGKPLAHSITGVLAVILGLMQPIFAFFRPHPGTPKRPLFNWAHRIIGSLAFILALASIFLSTKLVKLRALRTLPIRNIMIAFVVIYAITEIVLFAIRAYKHRQRQLDAKSSYDLNPIDPATGIPIGITNPAYTGNLPLGPQTNSVLPPDTHKGNKWTVLKFMIISIFGVVTLGFVIAMIILIAT